MKKRKPIKCHAKSSSKHESHISEQQEDNSISLSADLLRTMISLAFGMLSYICAIFGIVSIFCVICTKWVSVLSIFGIANLIIMISQCILTIVYFHAKRNCSLFKRIQSILLFLSLCIFFICFISLGFNIVAESLTYFGLGNLAAILFPLFFSIHKEISSEKNKDYIVNYFSALTAFAALIVSLIALINSK